MIKEKFYFKKVKNRELEYFYNLRLWCVVTDGLCSNSPPKESEGAEAAASLGNLGNGDVCVWAKHLILKRLKVSWNPRGQIKYKNWMHVLERWSF